MDRTFWVGFGGSTVQPSSRRPVLGLSVASAGAGLLTGVAAAVGAGPFSGLHAQSTSPAAARLTPVSASVLFPRPAVGPPVVKNVDVYDHSAAPAPPAEAPRPALSTGVVAPVLHSTPSQCGDDGCHSSQGDGGGSGGDD